MMFEAPELLFALFASGAVLAFGLAAWLINALVFYRMAQKADVRNAWLAFIPVFQFILFFHLLDKSAWNVLWLLVPLLNVVLGLYWLYQLFERFDAGGTMGILVIVLSVFAGLPLALYFFYIAFGDKAYVAQHRYHP